MSTARPWTVAHSWQFGAIVQTENNGNEIRGQVFDFSGEKFGREFDANLARRASQRDAESVPLDNGDTVVLWSDKRETGSDTDRYRIRTRLHSPDGDPVEGPQTTGNATIDTGLPVDVNTDLRGRDQVAPDLAPLVNGGLVGVWHGNSRSGDDGDRNGLRAQRFDGNGSPVGEEMQLNA